MPSKRVSGKKSSRSSHTGKQGIGGTRVSKNPAYPVLVKQSRVAFLLFFSAVFGIILAIGLWKGGEFAFRFFNRGKRYDHLIVASAQKNGIDPCLLKAVIWKESRFDTDCIGSKGEVGLMQVMQQYAVKDWEKAFGRKIPSKGVLANPELNIEIGSWYLGQALKSWKDYKDCEILALCEYNAGVQRANDWKPLMPDASMIDSISIDSTRRYVDEILTKRKEYEQNWNWKKLKK